MVTANGGGQGVLIDDLAVIGNEYRNNLDIVNVDTVRYSASGEEHELSVTVRGIGLEEQSGVTVAARITDSNGLRVWPSDRTFNFFTIPGFLLRVKSLLLTQVQQVQIGSGVQILDQVSTECTFKH